VAAAGGAQHRQQLAAAHRLQRLVGAAAEEIELIGGAPAGAEDHPRGLEAARAVLPDVDRLGADLLDGRPMRTGRAPAGARRCR
jgi:hypothetical protein